MSNAPYFSFVIPTYNRAGILVNTLRSILDQSFDDLEIIVVDDGSTDNTGEVVRGLGGSKVRYERINNSERGAARNHGKRLASGTYLNFFDSDDLLLPCLTELHEFAQVRGEPEVVFGNIEHGTGDNQRFDERLLYNNFLACGSVFLRNDVAKEFDFNEDRRLSSAEDWELWLRINARHTFSHFPKPVLRQLNHPQRSLATISAENIETRELYFASIVLNNNELIKYYGRAAILRFVADRYTFTALAMCDQSRRKAVKYWSRSLMTTPRVAGHRRFWAVLKKLIFK